MRWSLATQLRLGFAAALVLVLVMCATTWWVTTEFEGSAREQQRNTAEMVAIAEAESAMWQLRYDVVQFMIGAAAARRRILGEEPKWYAIIESSLEKYARTVHWTAEREALTELRAQYLRYKAARPKFFELYGAGEIEDALAWRALTITPYGAATVNAFARQIDLSRAQVARDIAEDSEQVKLTQITVTTLSVVLLLLLVLAYWVGQRMLRPIYALRAQAQGMVREQLGETTDAAAGANEVAALVGSFQLMSERLRAHVEALRQSRERLDFLLRATPAVIWSSRAGDFGATYASPNLRARFGYDPEEFTSNPGFWLSHLHPDDRERILAGLAVIEREDSHVHEYRFRHKDGSWRWVRDELRVVRDASGTSQELVGCWLDITDRKWAEDALRESGKRLREAQRMAHLGHLQVDAASGRMIWSDEMYAIFGRDPASFRPDLQTYYAELVHPDDRAALQAAEQAAYRDGGTHRPDHRILRPDGSVRWVHAEGRAEFDAAGRPLRIVGTVQDITERHEAEAAVAEALRVKTEFMNNVTHELRTPLNSVIGFAELLADEVPGPLNAKQAAFAADILAGGKRLLALVEGILEMSRLDAAGAAIEREPVEIGAALAERVAAQRQAAGRRGIAIRLDVAPDSGSAELDPKTLRRMLDALLDNAIKFNCDGGAVAVRARRDAGWLEISVADTGIGIARENLARLFRPLVQLDAGLARKHGGTGLGLALAHRLAKLHGGTIEVESEPGKGSTFTLRLPIQEKKQ